jgi:hypothetical protein
MRYVVARFMTDAPLYTRPLSKIKKTWIGMYGAPSENPFSPPPPANANNRNVSIPQAIGSWVA